MTTFKAPFVNLAPPPPQSEAGYKRFELPIVVREFGRQSVINSFTAIAGAIIGLLLVFYNSKNLNCIGALIFFKDLFTHCHDF